MKQCSKCGARKPLDAFGKHVIMPDGLRTSCRGCVNAYNARYRETRGDDLKRSKAEYEKRNAAAVKAKKADYRKRNIEREKERAAAYYRANAEARKNAVAQYQAQNRGAVRRYKQKHKTNNRAAHNAFGAAYRAAKRSATPAWADHNKMAEFYFAADFLSMVTGEWHHVDHIVPLQGKTVCGLHVEHNLQVLTGEENMRKGNRYWPGMP